MRRVLIYDAVRSPRGRARGDGGLANTSVFDLLAQLLRAITERTAIPPEAIEDLLLGCVTQQGEQAGNIARAAILYADFPQHIPGITINRFCSSSLDAICIAADRIRAGSQKLVLAGGVESMSRTDLFTDQPSWMVNTSLSRRARFIPMGLSADLIASLVGITRQQADNYALTSQQRVLVASKGGRSIIPINTPEGVFECEQVPRADSSAELLASLAVAFADTGLDDQLLQRFTQIRELDHIHTAGNSPAKADGASLLCIGAEDFSETVAPLAEIVAYKTVASDPYTGLQGGYQATLALLEQENLTVDEIALFEYNESFAAPTLDFANKLGIDHSKLNINGGAIALGHPMGATGGILSATLLDVLPVNQLGIVSICGAAGSGTAMLLKRF